MIPVVAPSFSSFLLASSQICTFYEPHLNETALKPQIEWVQEAITDEKAVPALSHPSINSVYNRTICWAINKETKEPIEGFRPISTSISCSTGCKPLVFHFSFEPTGNLHKIIQDAEQPLLKAHHAPFDQKDLDKLNGVVKNFDDHVFLKLTSMSDLTDPTQPATPDFAPQTLTAYKDVTINGAAYSTYVIFDVVLKNRQYLSPLALEQSKKQQMVHQRPMHQRSDVALLKTSPQIILDELNPIGISYHNQDIQLNLKDEIKKGRRAVLFFAPWCGHCFHTMAHLAKNASQELIDRLLLIGIFEDEDDQAPKKYFKDQTGLALRPDLMVVTLKDQPIELLKQLHLYSVPKMFVASKEGNLFSLSLKEPLVFTNEQEKELFWVLDQL